MRLKKEIKQKIAEEKAKAEIETEKKLTPKNEHVRRFVNFWLALEEALKRKYGKN